MEIDFLPQEKGEQQNHGGMGYCFREGPHR
jgi:hypothetical protein